MRIPTPPQLDEHPEDAVLALLDETLLISVRSLLAAHPDIDDPRPYWEPPPTTASRSARQVISRAYELLGALADYKRARDVCDEDIDDDDIPF